MESDPDSSQFLQFLHNSSNSNSDFTRLATHIREAGLVVYGFGERKTPELFMAACDKFT